MMFAKSQSPSGSYSLIRKVNGAGWWWIHISPPAVMFWEWQAGTYGSTQDPALYLSRGS